MRGDEGRELLLVQGGLSTGNCIERERLCGDADQQQYYVALISAVAGSAGGALVVSPVDVGPHWIANKSS